ncbi:MAG: MarR family transcriptional regulator [Bacteroidales bacterium]|jgi:DNA-binding MarR family transcriptional regulator|nr:MarR family transcriptional regulator [Bacteroidales bacterium]
MEDSQVSEFRRILRHFERELEFQNQSGCCCGVTLTQCHALMELALNDNITMNELADRLHLDKSTVSRTVDNLVQADLIDRKIPASNRRTTMIKLTKKGRSVCKTINNGNNQFFIQALNAIPSDKLADFLQSFEQLTSAMMKLNKS